MQAMSIMNLKQTWDLIIIGGGITAAGILREAVRMGLQTLLLEQRDFAWGTSSRSSKLVHGGLRYLKEGKIFLTKIAVEEREFLLQDAPGLVEPLPFLLPVYEDQRPGKRLLKIGLSIYDLMAHEKQHRFYDATEFARLMPIVKREGLLGGFHYTDAQTDDARLVLRLIHESIAAGATALNYTTATEILRDHAGNVSGVKLKDTETHAAKTLTAKTVINATGCWAEKLHPSPDPRRHLRPLRGSHLVFPADILPIDQGFGFIHPTDKRSVFITPWEGAILIGTTDLDHSKDLAREPKITAEEIDYLMTGVKSVFPSLDVARHHCIAAFAGIRPVLSEGKEDPSEESREHVVWVDKGLVTVTGGKLTTFRRLAWDALKSARPFLPSANLPDHKTMIFAEVPQESPQKHGLTSFAWRRLYGRYGKAADLLVTQAASKDLSAIPGTHTLWAELPFVARNETIRHLDDLLLRRVRIGLLTPHGGLQHMKRIKRLCQPMLPWNRQRWKEEIKAYTDLWYATYALPHQRSAFLEQQSTGPFQAIRTLVGNLFSKPRPKRTLH